MMTGRNLLPAHLQSGDPILGSWAQCKQSGQKSRDAVSAANHFGLALPLAQSYYYEDVVEKRWQHWRIRQHWSSQMKTGDIVKELRRVATELGQNSLSISDFRTHGRISLSVVRGKFGTWNAAIKEAGLDPIPPVTIRVQGPGLTEEELLQDIIRVTKEVGKIPTHTSVRRFGSFSERRWGQKSVGLGHRGTPAR